MSRLRVRILITASGFLKLDFRLNEREHYPTEDTMVGLGSAVTTDRDSKGAAKGRKRFYCCLRKTPLLNQTPHRGLSCTLYFVDYGSCQFGSENIMESRIMRWPPSASNPTRRLPACRGGRRRLAVRGFASVARFFAFVPGEIWICCRCCWTSGDSCHSIWLHERLSYWDPNPSGIPGTTHRM